LRLLAETGMRAGELLALNTADVDLGRGLAVVRRGKGGKGRVVAFTPQTGAAVDRYLRVRRGHRLASTPALWLPETGNRDRL
jgi:integrase/recombinase XerD